MNRPLELYSFYFSNILENVNHLTLKRYFSEFDLVVEVFIHEKQNKVGAIFGFV